jgi:hypothetical protein
MIALQEGSIDVVQEWREIRSSRVSIPYSFQKGKDFGQDIAFRPSLHFGSETMTGSIHDDQTMQDSGFLKLLRQLLRLFERNPPVVPAMEEQHGGIVGGDICDRRRIGGTIAKLGRVVTQEDASGIMGQVTSGLGKAIEVGGAIEIDDCPDPAGDPVLIRRIGKGAEERGEVGPGGLPESDDPIRVDAKFSGVSSRPPHGLAEVVESPLPTGRAGPGESVVDRDDNVSCPCQAGDR